MNMLFSLALVVALADFGLSASPLVILDDKPARQWASEAYPLGNGRLGCMVFGGVERERIQFNEDSLWTGDRNPSGKYETMGAYQNFGELLLEQPATNSAASTAASTPGQYRRELDLAEAIVRVSWQQDGVLYQREVFASNPDEIIAVRLSANRPAACSGRCILKGAHREETRVENRDLAFDGKFENGLSYEARVRAINTGGNLVFTNGAIEFNGCDSLIIILAAGTSYLMDETRNWQGPHPRQRMLTQLNNAAKRGWQSLKQRHQEDFQSLFNRAKLDVGQTPPEQLSKTTRQRLADYAKGGADPDLEELLFQYGRYLLISCSRVNGLPANLQGLWNDSNNPPWHCDYHSNINIQMNYWLAEPANLSECHLPFFNLVMAMREPSRQATRAAFGPVRGWTARTSHNIFGGHGWEWNIPASAWYAQHFWEHYAFTGDKQFLQKTAYPLLKEVCEFWEDHLKELPDKTLVAPKGWSPEHGPREDGVAHDQQIIWDLFTNFIEASDAANTDTAYRQRIASLRERLAGPKIGRWGQLQEWMVDRDDPKDQHRHTSHLFAVYPGRQINPTQTPELAKAAAVSLAARGESGDSRRSWTWPWRCALWARLNQPENAYRMVRGLLTYNMLPNLLATHPPMQMDGNFGITAGICEILVQSHAGQIAILPALPAAWSNGSFSGLRARGGFEVGASWKAGKPVEATLTSLLGKPVVLQTPIPIRAVTSNGKPVGIQTVGNTVRFQTQAGRKYLLAF